MLIDRLDNFWGVYVNIKKECNFNLDWKENLSRVWMHQMKLVEYITYTFFINLRKSDFVYKSNSLSPQRRISQT